ncbi:fructosamine-3-kinase [Saccharothrix carnea]|uniref:Fructosamine-3-kinase n=1 Tax=Saccharothrix carnea TaxID=1280637 RepID=A0A2P8HZZ7_SACCR|nr:fructosamine kinase family protein [Saccharothrix carnea]PSL51783.1 fructosamine-3-kinase [Saccharothrix carnea]
MTAREVLARLGENAEVARLTGGVVNTVWHIRGPGRAHVLKTAEHAPPSLFRVEADGLAVLRRHGLRTPDVLDVGADWLLLEALTPQPLETDAFWESAGRAIAALHDVRGPRFGWDHDGWLGLLPQRNTWTDDGHAFFVEHRLLRYLDEPKADAVLTAEDRAALERLCARLPEIVPAAPPSLTHGDLWHNNVVSTAAGEPAFIDPAVSWAWPDVDLSMMFCGTDSPARFFDAYHEVRPLDRDWRDRMPVVFLREVLSTLAHEGDRWGSLDYFREVLRPFRTALR